MEEQFEETEELPEEPTEEQVEVSDIHVKLQRLWKGTLFVGITGGYVLIVSLLFIYHGWRPALLGLFLIILSQFFRYIANDVDRIGWKISKQEHGEGITESTRGYQVRMLYLLVGLVQLQNLALIYQGYVLAGLTWTVGTLAGLAFIEILFSRVRGVNRRVEFEQASYGFRDKGVFSDGPESVSPSDRVKRDKLERKLDRLGEMAEKGQISQKAYEKTRDRYRIHAVMDDDRILRGRY